MDTCFNYYGKFKAQTLSSYPYVAKSGACKYQSSLGITNTNGYLYAKRNDPASILAALAKQPLSIGISAGK